MQDTDSLSQTLELSNSMTLDSLQVQDMSSWHQSFGWSSNVIRLRELLVCSVVVRHQLQ